MFSVAIPDQGQDSEGVESTRRMQKDCHQASLLKHKRKTEQNFHSRTEHFHGLQLYFYRSLANVTNQKTFQPQR